MEPKPAKIPRRPSRRRWLKRGLILAGAVLAAALLSPFVFTGSLVRYALARSAYRDLPLKFQSARLSPFGRLTLYKVALEDTGEYRGRPLLSADKAEISFRWADLSSARLEQVALENLDLTIRPGKETPVTLLRLLHGGDAAASQTAPASAPAAASTPANPNQKSPWVDQLLVSGVVRFEGYGRALSAYGIGENVPLPVHMMVTSSGSLASWNGSLSLVAGETTGSQPRMSARLSALGAGDTATLKLESLSVENAPGNFASDIHLQIDSLSLGGSLTLGHNNALSATAELRDLNARGTARGVPVILRHFAAAGHAEGRLGTEPLTDLVFSRLRASWDGVGVADWDFGKGVADLAIQEKEFEPEGRELELTELQTTVADAAFDATGAYDLANRIVSRGRVTLNNFEAPKVLALLPEKMRRAVPWELQGRMSARMLLKESDPFHMIAHVELLEPERLQAFAPNRPAASTRTPLAVVSNFDLSGDIYFPLQPAGMPDVSSGRFTADQILLATPGRPLEAGLALGKIKSDFTYTPDGKAQLNDFYADLPGNGRLSVDGEYIAATGALSHSTLNLNGVDASLVNPWMPAGWTLTGQIDAGVQLALSQKNAEGTLSLGFGAQSALRSPDGVLTLTGSPAPTAAAHVAFDRVTGIVKWDTGELTNFGALQLDAGMVKAARQWFNPAAGSALDKVLDAAAGGAMLSFDKFGITGSRGADRSFAGNLVLNGLDFSVATDKTPRLQNLTFKAGLSLPATPDLPAIKLTDGQLLAEKLTIGQEVLTEITTAMTIDQGKLLVNRLAFAGAEGSVEGDAALTLPAQLDTLHLSFTNLSQQILTASLYPDKFTAEGPVSGKLTLSHTNAGIGGSADLVLDKPGRLKIARETAKEVFAPQALAAAKSQLSMLPDNFEDIVISQLADFPYTSGRVALEIFPDRIGITPNYVRPPLKAGDPGYSVPVTLEGQHVNIALEFQLKGLTLMVHQLFTEVIRNTAVMKSFTNPPKQNP